jgi:hypothetical protein
LEEYTQRGRTKNIGDKRSSLFQVYFDKEEKDPLELSFWIRLCDDEGAVLINSLGQNSGAETFCLLAFHPPLQKDLLSL